MKILVTGALGVVGTPLVKELRRRGYDVWMLDLRHHHDSKFIRCNVVSHKQLFKAFEHKFDLVYHLAAEFGRWNGESFYDDLWKTNVIGTKNIIRFQEELQFRLVLFSSSEVYGDYREEMFEDIMDEVEIKQLNDYAMTKWVNEMQVLNSANMFNTQTVRIRLFNTYGPGEYYTPCRSVISLFTYAALHKMLLPLYRNHSRSFLYIDDAVRTIANIAERFKAGEVYNIAGHKSYAIGEVSDIILKHAGTDGSHLRYEDSEPFTTKYKKVSIEKAIKDLEHSPVTRIEVGLERTVAWMREVYCKAS